MSDDSTCTLIATPGSPLARDSQDKLRRLGVAAPTRVYLSSFFACVTTWIITIPALWAATNVVLTVTERAGVGRTSEPVTSGVPIPRELLRNAEKARLLLEGKEVPVQFRATGFWWPGDSIRWLLVDFQTSLGANETRHYRLEFGEDVVPHSNPTTQLVVEQTDAAYTVRTGPATFTISKKSFTLFDQVTLKGRPMLAGTSPQKSGAVVRGLHAMATRPIPLQNTGKSHLIYVKVADQVQEDDYTLRFVTDQEYELSGKGSGVVGRGFYRKDFTTSDGLVTIPRDAWLAYHAPKAGDGYMFRTIPAGTVLRSEGVLDTCVLERGPLRAVIRVKGSFGPPAAPALEYTAWYHFYAGTSRVKLVFTVENNNHGGRTDTGNARNADIGGINCVFFDSLSLLLPFQTGDSVKVTLGTDEESSIAEPLGESLELYQDSSSGTHWDRYRDPKFHPRPNSYVSFTGWKIFKNGTEVAHGRRAKGWLDLSGPNSGVTIAVLDFWQNYPKDLSVNAEGVVDVGLFPVRYAADFPLRSGEHKTHEVLFFFHDGSASPKEREALALGFSAPLCLEPSAEWFAATRVFGDLHPFDMQSYRDYEVRNLSTVGIFPEDVAKSPSLLSRIEQFEFYGWMDYGDVPIDFEVPSGQWGMKYDFDYQMALQYARTLRPEWWNLFVTAAKHTRDIDIHHQPHYPRLHYVKGGVWAHSLHDEPGHKNPHRNYNHFTKDLCFGARGTAALYYLTGDWKAREACLEIAENALAEYMSPQKDPGDPKNNNRMGVRGDACTLNRLLEGYLMTGEERYLERARWQIKSCAYDGKPADHKPVSLWSAVFYMMALVRYAEIFPDDVAARSYLLAHLETLRRAVDPENGIMYTITPKPDGTVTGSGTCSHYNIMAADALALGYRLTGDMQFMTAARQCFAYGVKNACWKNGPPTYFHVHSANGATHGNVFMVEDSRLRAVGK